MEEPARKVFGPMYPTARQAADTVRRIRVAVDALAKTAEREIAERALNLMDNVALGLPAPRDIAYELGQAEYFLGEALKEMDRAVEHLREYHAQKVGVR